MSWDFETEPNFRKNWIGLTSLSVTKSNRSIIFWEARMTFTIPTTRSWCGPCKQRSKNTSCGHVIWGQSWADQGMGNSSLAYE